MDVDVDKKKHLKSTIVKERRQFKKNEEKDCWKNENLRHRQGRQRPKEWNGKKTKDETCKLRREENLLKWTSGPQPSKALI